jgi:hypothetical protein
MRSSQKKEKNRVYAAPFVSHNKKGKNLDRVEYCLQDLNVDMNPNPGGYFKML